MLRARHLRQQSVPVVLVANKDYYVQGRPYLGRIVYRIIPSQATISPSMAVTRTCPLPASAVIASVFVRLHFWARAVRTNGSQCVGMAA